MFGGICHEDRKFFLVTVPNWDKETLLPLIKERIAAGTTIMSDCWKSYDCLSQEDFEYLTVNHSLHFVDPDTGCHTQNIENLWWQVKRNLPNTHNKHSQLYLHLAQYMWRLMRDQTDDMFLQFLKDAAKFYKGQVSNCFSS